MYVYLGFRCISVSYTHLKQLCTGIAQLYTRHRRFVLYYVLIFSIKPFYSFLNISTASWRLRFSVFVCNIGPNTPTIRFFKSTVHSIQKNIFDNLISYFLCTNLVISNRLHCYDGRIIVVLYSENRMVDVYKRQV